MWSTPVYIIINIDHSLICFINTDCYVDLCIWNAMLWQDQLPVFQKVCFGLTPKQIITKRFEFQDAWIQFWVEKLVVEKHTIQLCMKNEIDKGQFLELYFETDY